MQLMQRVANLRGNWKKVAAQKVEAVFGLHVTGRGQAKRISSLVKKEIKGLTFVYPRNAVRRLSLFC